MHVSNRFRDLHHVTRAIPSIAMIRSFFTCRFLSALFAAAGAVLVAALCLTSATSQQLTTSGGSYVQKGAAKKDNSGADTLIPREPESAIARFEAFQEQLRKARASKDWQTYAATARELEQFLNESPEAHLEMARALSDTGNLSEAIHELKQFAQMGQYSSLIQLSAEFEPVRKLSDFAALERDMQQNRTPISRSSQLCDVSDPALLTEDIDYDSQKKRFLITSVREKKIVSVDASGVIRDFARSPDDWPFLAVKIDPKRKVVWATEVALRGFVFVPQKDWGRSAVLRYDLRSGSLLQRVEGPHGSALGDMALTSQGEVIVSDGEGGGVYRVSANGGALPRLDNGDFMSPQTPVMLPDGERILVPDYVRGIAVLEIATKKVRWLPTDGKFALNGIDGMYLNRRTLIAVQNGSSPERVVAFTLNRELTGITSEDVFERSTATLGDPTHGVVDNGNFYYIANSGWDVIDEHGNLKPGSKVSAAHIMRVQLAH